MEVGNFPTNSGRPQENKSTERTPVESVALSGSVKTRKKSKLQELKHSFIHQDMKRLKEYAVEDILIPSLKRGIDDIVSNGIHMLLYGEAKKSSGGTTLFRQPLGTSSVSYRRISENPNSNYAEPRRTKGFEYEDILFDNYGDAQLFLRKMGSVIEDRGIIDLLTMYDMADINVPYTYGDYGWKDISRATIYSERVDGELKYIIDFPPALPLK